MQSLWRSVCHQALLVNSSAHSRRMMPMVAQSKFMRAPMRAYATEIEVKKQEETGVDAEQRNQRLGIDMTFNQAKHAYVLTFPWNFQEIISDYENLRALPSSNFWHRFIFTNAEYDFNSLFREFHQHCALPDYENIDKVCEGKLAQYVKESVRRIHFHGLDIEMANLTVEQPNMKLLKVEVSHGISVDRSQNKPLSEYNVYKGKLFGAPKTVYTPKNNDTRSFLDHLDYDYKPYTIAATVLIESPMKLYVQNQNFSAVLFGSTDEEIVKNVVRFETQVRWIDLFKILPVGNKPRHNWKITDFNNVLNENPYLPQY